MTQEEKELLLQDLCARLPYGVKVTTTNPAVKIGIISGISIKNKISVETKHANIVFDCTEVKPYLRPMSSMTEEEEKEYINIDNRSYSCPMAYAHIPASARIDWFNAHHFDYRGLIEKGLAIGVTEENNPYKTEQS